MRKFKKVLAVVMAAAVTVTACPSVTAEGVVSVSDVLKSSGVISQVNAGERSSEGDYKYQVSFDSIEIIRYIGKGGDVVIPSEIEGKKVTDIGDSAFAENKSITSVKIPNTVHSISQMAFSGCSSLTSVNIPNSVREIGSNAFYGCTSLTSVNIPESVSEMYGYHVFEGCSSLKSINVDDNNSNFSSLNGVLFNKDKTFLIQYPAKKEDKSYSIPNSVTNIEDIAFNGCTSLTSVKVPEGLTRIGGFSGCTALTSVNIPNSVTTIEGNAFSGCTSLTSIEIPNSVEEIYANAFSGCTYLASIDIPNNVTYIGNEVFSNCSSLKSINVNEKNANYSSLDGVLFNKDKTKLIKYPEGKEDKSYSIPNDVTEIANAFRNCIFLTSVRLPSGLKIIGSVMEFDGCSSLQSIEVDEKNENYTSIDGVLFYKDKTRLVLYPAAKENESYSIPNGVVWIDYAAFNRCSNLVSVVIPSSVETIIFHRGFYRCTSLKSIIVDENNKDYSSVDGVLFTKNKGALLQYPLGKTDTSYSIPDSVKYIGDEAFCGCTYLNSVEIPNNVENIFINAFSNCTSLVSVIIYSDKITSFGESYISSWIYEREVFDNCPALTVYGYENSYVQGYMNKYNIPFKIIGKEALIDPESYIMIENPNLENLTLEAKKSADSTDFRMIYNITLKDEAGKEVQPAGEVTVKLPLPEGWKDAAVSRRESNNALTDMNAVCENGYAVFVTDHFSEYVLALKPDTQLGDLNSDKTTNAIDAKWVLQYVSGSRALTPAQKAAADVNSDGTVNAVDAKWILQSVSGSRVLG